MKCNYSSVSRKPRITGDREQGDCREPGSGRTPIPNKILGGGRSPGLLPRGHVSHVGLFSTGHLKGACPMQAPFGFPGGIDDQQTVMTLSRD
ncbi:MAG: hypothetical protein OXH65_12790 [Paracoccaceae bacterium]|nr:hypothetical protein [Paracoccaceae bacterium]MDE2675972.1 hypothetical protein [Paracoccaceae bacterium]